MPDVAQISDSCDALGLKFTRVEPGPDLQYNSDTWTQVPTSEAYNGT